MALATKSTKFLAGLKPALAAMVETYEEREQKRSAGESSRTTEKQRQKQYKGEREGGREERRRGRARQIEERKICFQLEMDPGRKKGKKAAREERGTEEEKAEGWERGNISRIAFQ
ncbi:uncharacterized protein MCYG_05942 [Microsporum canis CBS 113480]|uniref:Uncharacterized protein n=1 Tax=Arthroderma otae (strain ATCC MYA-4605 / CBS 113480) TaxID=554155 RepID=C5FTC0_ARTOC|nr:uncharacterized protein MCYG_05942 [Microsporum canis CBS 113480]EEQ33123.1 predicted protein [Microsporum canis CBS 113480]